MLAPPVTAALTAPAFRPASVVISALDVDSARSRILAFHPGGLILFGGDVADGGAAVRRAVAQVGAPLPLVLVDQEGGSVRRFTDLGPDPARTLGGRRASVTYAQFRAVARALRRRGVDVDLAPVADVDHGGVIGSRSYGPTVARVAPRVRAAVAGLRDGGVSGCIKHFPGLGAVTVNTDAAVAVDPRPPARVLADLATVAAGVTAGARCVMISSVVVPSLCPHLPAVLCPTFYARLRATGFRGAIVTDSLDATGLRPWGSPAAIAVRALRLGADGVLITGPGSTAGTIVAIRRAIARGMLAPARLAASAARLAALRRSTPGDGTG